MKVAGFYLFTFILLSIIVLNGSCKKSTTDTSGCYIPTIADTTATATLAELQQGRSLYIGNCNACHSLHSPDDYSASYWKSIMNQMGPRTSLNSTQLLLVQKYVCRGK